MSFFVYHRYGASERDPPRSVFPALLDELEEHLDDREHTSVSVVHESEWALGIGRGGHVTFEHVESAGESRHMSGLSRSKVIELMESLSAGDLAALERNPWKPGY